MERDEQTFQDQIEAQIRQMRQGAEDVIKDIGQNIEIYDRLRWHMAAECSHAVAILRIIDHRDSIIGALVDRLSPQQLPPPVPQQQRAPDLEPDDEQTLSKILQGMRQAAEDRVRRRAPEPQAQPTQEDWGYEQGRYTNYGNGSGRG